MKEQNTMEIDVFQFKILWKRNVNCFGSIQRESKIWSQQFYEAGVYEYDLNLCGQS